jgi:hypothetical protein
MLLHSHGWRALAIRVKHGAGDYAHGYEQEIALVSGGSTQPVLPGNGSASYPDLNYCKNIF